MGEEQTGHEGEEDTGQKSAEHVEDEGNKPERAGQLAEKPEPDESAKEKAKEMRKAYDDDIETAVLPGSDGSVTGTAVNAWLDDEGNPKFGKEEGEKAERRAEGGSGG